MSNREFITIRVLTVLAFGVGCALSGGLFTSPASAVGAFLSLSIGYGIGCYHCRSEFKAGDWTPRIKKLLGEE